MKKKKLKEYIRKEFNKYMNDLCTIPDAIEIPTSSFTPLLGVHDLPQEIDLMTTSGMQTVKPALKENSGRVNIIYYNEYGLVLLYERVRDFQELQIALSDLIKDVEFWSNNDTSDLHKWFTH